MALTVDGITAAASGILSRYGLGDLSMRRLARELDVQPSALYWHVKNKQELLVLIAKQIRVEVDELGAGEGSPIIAMQHLRTVLLGYREGAEIMLLGYSLNPAEVTPTQLSVEKLGSQASHGLMSFGLGAVAIEQNRRLFHDVAESQTGHPNDAITAAQNELYLQTASTILNRHAESTVPAK